MRALIVSIAAGYHDRRFRSLWASFKTQPDGNPISLKQLRCFALLWLVETRRHGLGQEMQQFPHDEKLMTRAEVEAHFGIGERYLVDLAMAGKGPVMVKFSRAVRYRAGDVRAWISRSAISPNPANGSTKQASQSAPKGYMMKEDLALRILTMLKRPAAPPEEIETLAAEAETARDAFCKRTVEIHELLSTSRPAQERSALKEEFTLARQTEEGLHQCARDLREFARAQRATT